jgi:dipeptidase E
VLLISSSTVHGTGYLDHAASQIEDFLGTRIGRVLFLPYALADRDAYAEKVRERFARLEKALDSAHQTPDPRAAVEQAEAVFVGGGNTFRLLADLHRLDLLEPIRRRVAEGMPYVGSSAGSNVACPTIKTTNDMPVIEPPSFEALGLVGFQINPHYLDPDPSSTHMGETREERIRQYHEENDLPVAALREGAILRVEGRSVTLQGRAGARLFRRGREPVEALPLAEVGSFLRAGGAAP